MRNSLIEQVRVRLGVRTRVKRAYQRLAWDLRSGSDRDELAARHLAGARHFNRIVCDSHPDARVVELDGVLASVIPAVADHAALNVVFYDDAAALERALDQVAATYREAGIDRWMVCAPPSDRAAAKVLRKNGYWLVSTPLGMTRALDNGHARPPAKPLEDWTAAGDPAVMAEISDQAFEFGDPFRRAYSKLPADRARIYIANHEGKPAACLVTTDHEGNCSIDMAATLPEARGLGLSSRLVSHALTDAAERGCELSTLTASEVARGVYERLGYTGFGPFEHWETICPR